jgi:hypothetical protein
MRAQELGSARMAERMTLAEQAAALARSDAAAARQAAECGCNGSQSCAHSVSNPSPYGNKDAGLVSEAVQRLERGLSEVCTAGDVRAAEQELRLTAAEHALAVLRGQLQEVGAARRSSWFMLTGSMDNMVKAATGESNLPTWLPILPGGVQREDGLISVHSEALGGAGRLGVGRTHPKSAARFLARPVRASGGMPHKRGAQKEDLSCLETLPLPLAGPHGGEASEELSTLARDMAASLLQVHHKSNIYQVRGAGGDVLTRSSAHYT